MKIYILFFFTFFRIHLYSQEKIIAYDTIETVKLMKQISKLSRNNPDSVIFVANYILSNKVIKDSTNLIDINYLMANSYYFKNNYSEATKYYYRGLEKAKQLNDSIKIVKSLINLGNVKYRINQEDRAIEHLNNAESILKSLDYKQKNVKQYFQKVYNNKGNCYVRLKKYSKAEKNLELSLRFCNELNLESSTARIHNNLGIFYEDQKKYKKAIKNYLKSYEYRKHKKNNTYQNANVLNNIGRTYIGMENYNKSEVFLNLAKVYIDSINSLYLQSNNDFNFCALYESKKQYKKAFEYFKKHKISYDSIINQKNNNQINTLEIKYETQQKENEILKLSNENIKKGAETEVKKNQLNYALFGGGTILLLSLFTLQAYRKEKKSKKQVVNQKREIETLHKELHHRVKNNLGIAKSFTKIAKRNISDSKGQEVLDALQSRIVSMANIHELLYQQENVSVINFQTYTERICDEISKTYNTLKENITYNIDAFVNIPIIEATPLGLILNEAITNSYKHAFKQQSDGVITIVLKENSDYIFCTISDNGIRIPLKESQTAKKSYGMELIHSLVMQLSGSIDIVTNNGTHIQITIPKNQNES